MRLEKATQRSAHLAWGAVLVGLALRIGVSTEGPSSPRSPPEGSGRSAGRSRHASGPDGPRLGRRPAACGGPLSSTG
jgi:hypothetical protein